MYTYYIYYLYKGGSYYISACVSAPNTQPLMNYKHFPMLLYELKMCKTGK